MALEKKRHWWQGALIGAAVGAALAFTDDVDPVLCEVNENVLCSRGEAILVYGLGSTAMGAGIGAPIKTDRWTPVALDAFGPPRAGAGVTPRSRGWSRLRKHRRNPMPVHNGVMMQAFHWYTPADGTHWDDLASKAKELAQAGFTALWLPPAYKGTGGGSDVGYGVYDMYDLGQFDQKGSVRTKYGTKRQYLAAVKALHKAGLQVYADTVLKNRMGADD